jgi:hypothetical protein
VTPTDPRLVVAALAGLCLAACSKEDTEEPVVGCGAELQNGEITSSVTDTTVTEASFRAECDSRGGTLEIHPHCGGANACKGMSYDLDTHVWTEHTCKGLNTCRGFSCVVCD